MKSKFLVLAALLVSALVASAQSTAFTYQGRLTDNGSPGSGTYDLRFQLYDLGTNIVAGTITNAPVSVSNGLFTVTLDFGSGVFDGSGRALEIAVRANGSPADFTVLSPRQALTSVPYAIRSIAAGVAANLASPLPATNLSGTLPDARLSTNVALLDRSVTFAGSVTATQFYGRGLGLTNLPATNLIGTLPDARLSTNVPLLNGNASFNGTLTATQFIGNGNATFNGTLSATQFVGNGYGLTNVPGAFFWVTVAGNSTPAFPNVGFLATNDAVPLTVTLPASPRIGDIYRVAAVGGAGWIIAQNASQTIFSANLSHNIGWSWTPRDSVRPWQAVASSGDGAKLVAAVYGGQIYTSADAGTTWTPRDIGRNWISLASSTDGSKLVAAVSGGQLYTSSNFGVSWTAHEANRGWHSVASSSDGAKLVAVVYGERIYTSTDSGGSWSPRDSIRNWYAVASSGDGSRLVAAEANNFLYLSTDSGVSWNPISGSSKAWTAVAASADGTKFVAAAAGDQIYYSNDGGTNWVVSGLADLLQWAAIACSADGSRMIAANNPGNIHLSNEGGATWMPRSSAPTLAWSSVASSADGSRLVAVANGDRIYTSSQATTTPGTTGYLSGSYQSAIEIQYVGNGKFMPLSAIGGIVPH